MLIEILFAVLADLMTPVALFGLVVALVCGAIRVRRHLRRHHPSANRRFLRVLRAERAQHAAVDQVDTASRTT